MLSKVRSYKNNDPNRIHRKKVSSDTSSSISSLVPGSGKFQYDTETKSTAPHVSAVTDSSKYQICFREAMAGLTISSIDLHNTRSSCMVFEGIRAEEKVSLNVWNGSTETGLDIICNEVEIYSLSQEKYFHILSVHVLNLIIESMLRPFQRICDEEIILDVSFVESEVKNLRDGFLIVCKNGFWKNKSRREDVQAIQSAALRSLSALHMNTLLHGDVAFRNLGSARARKRDE